VITGASAGVGRATARLFAERGADVALIARGAEGLAEAKREAEERGARAIALQIDVSDAEALDAAASEIEASLGPIDIWVNNAMVTVMSPVPLMSPGDYRRVTDVTYLGAVYGTLAALRRMRPRNHGTIVQVGSALAYRAIPLQSAYCAAKFALRGFTDSLRSELQHDRSKVHVTMVQLPALNTPQFDWSKIRFFRNPQPVPPIFQPEVAAEAIHYAAHSDRREVWVGGRNAVLIALNKLFPAAGDWYLAKKGYRAQFTDEYASPNRAHNLYQPLPGDRGAHGRFDAAAHRFSLELWMSEHRSLVAVAALGAAAIGSTFFRRSS
jgi:NAD(P)-dependent dehydrogenase (short-subunit alcohol dehydrogenase family)